MLISLQKMLYLRVFNVNITGRGEVEDACLRNCKCSGREGDQAPDVVSIVDLISLSPFLVQQLLELFMSYNLLVPIEDCNVKICIVVATI